MKIQGKVWLFFDSETKTQSKPLSVVQAQAYLLSLTDLTKSFIWTPGWEEWQCVEDFLSSEHNQFFLAGPPKLPPEFEGTTTGAVKRAPGEETMTVTKTNSSDGDYSYTKVVSSKPIKEGDTYGYFHRDFNGDELDIKKIKPMKMDSSKKKSSSKDSTSNSNNSADSTATTSSSASTSEKPIQTGSDRRKDPRHVFKIEVILVSNERSFRTHSRDISLSGTQLEEEIPKGFLNRPFDLIIANPFEQDPAKARLLFRAKIVGDMTDPRRLMFIEQDETMTHRLDALLKAYVMYQQQVRNRAG